MLLTVTVIFEDPGVQELIVKIYHNGKITFLITKGTHGEIDSIHFANVIYIFDKHLFSLLLPFA